MDTSGRDTTTGLSSDMSSNPCTVTPNSIMIPLAVTMTAWCAVFLAAALLLPLAVSAICLAVAVAAAVWTFAAIVVDRRRHPVIPPAA